MRKQYRLHCTILALGLGLTVASGVSADARTQAKRLHDRLAGVPPSAAVLDTMEDDINGVGGRSALDAAFTAMDNPDFYRVTLKNFVTPWTNEEQTVFAPLNDYSATVIGMIRDNADFREVLSGNILYRGNNSFSPAYANNSNAHYENLEAQHADLSDNSVLIVTTQTAVTGLPDAATAGVMTTRAAAKAFFVGGTNRAMFRFTLMNHMCNDLEQVKDITGVPDRIRQDVSRSPGGDSRIFMNSCVGCHSGMDPMAQAFAYYEYDYPLDGNGDPNYEAGQMVFTDGVVQPKYHINDKTFEYGFVTPDDSWDNYWRIGPNSALGWGSASVGATTGQPVTGSGNGAKTMGEELANSEAFAECQVKKVFKAVCLRDPVDSNDRTQISDMVASFKGTNYNMKQVFAESAVYCMGD